MLHTVACIYLLKIQSNHSMSRGVYTVSCLWLLNRLLLYTLAVYLLLCFHCIFIYLPFIILFFISTSKRYNQTLFQILSEPQASWITVVI